MSPLTKHLCVFVCECCCVCSTGWPLSVIPTLIASFCSPGSHVKSIPLSPSLYSSPALPLFILPSLAISDLYLMSFPVLKVEENWGMCSACLWVYIYGRDQGKLSHAELCLSNLVQLYSSPISLTLILDTWFQTLLNWIIVTIWPA